MWPGLVGKGGPGAEPPIDLDTMLDMTAKAQANGAKFDGVDLFLFDPHVSIDSTDDDLKRLADKIGGKSLAVGSLVAPVWPPTGGGSAMGSDEERQNFLTQVRKACAIGKKLKRHRHPEVRRRPHRLGGESRPTGRRIRQATRRRSPRRSARPAMSPSEYGERLAAEGEICWGGMHSVKRNVELMEMVNRPKTLGFQADMAHTLLFTMGYNAPDDRILPENFDWSDKKALDEGLKTMTRALRPWTIDFHVAQNDATVKGSGSHDKTGRSLPAARSERQARHRPPRRLLAERRQRHSRRGRSSTSAGTAACSRTR